MTPMTTHTHSATMCASHAICEEWVTPLPMLSCQGCGAAGSAAGAANALAAAARASAANMPLTSMLFAGMPRAIVLKPAFISSSPAGECNCCCLSVDGRRPACFQQRAKALRQLPSFGRAEEGADLAAPATARQHDPLPVAVDVQPHP